MNADDRAWANYGKQVEELRQQLTKEKDDACEKEREQSHQRFSFSLVIQNKYLQIL